MPNVDTEARAERIERPVILTEGLEQRQETVRDPSETRPIPLAFEVGIEIPQKLHSHPQGDVGERCPALEGPVPLHHRMQVNLTRFVSSFEKCIQLDLVAQLRLGHTRRYTTTLPA
jgi:hypothetical protein